MYNPLFDIEGKIALLTGSARGLGYGYAKTFLEAGCKVIFNGVNKENLDATVAELQKEGWPAYGYAFDVTDEQAVEESIEKIEQEVGPIDILVNNAGIQRRVPMTEFPIDTWREVIDTNLTGVFIVGRAVGKRMVKRGKGKIINITSLNAILARENICAYSSAKGGVTMLTKSMATEFGPYGVTVNAVGPGYISTDMTRALADDPAFDSWVKSEVPMKRWGLPEDIVGSVLFFASPASDYVQGQTVFVDGGWTSCL